MVFAVHNADKYIDLVKSAEYVAPVYKEDEAQEYIEDDYTRNIRLKKKIREAEYKEKFNKQQKERERKLKDVKLRREERFNTMFTELLEEKEGFVKELTLKMKLKGKANQRKKEQLYNQWVQKVYNPINAQITQKISQTSVKELETRRRKLFEEYLHATNTKLGIFRDIIIESDYDPLANRKNFIRYSANTVNDPVKKTLAKQIEENRMAKPSSEITKEDFNLTKSKKRYTLNSTLWGIIEATPHGHYTKILANEEKLTMEDRLKNVNMNRASNIVINHFDYDASQYSLKNHGEVQPGKQMFNNKREFKPNFLEFKENEK